MRLNASLKLRTLPKPDARAIWPTGSEVSSSSFFAKCRRCVMAMDRGDAPRCRVNRRLTWRGVTPRFRDKSSTLRPRSAPSATNRSVRDTVVETPFHAGLPGADSGRHRRHGRKPASAAAPAVGKYRTFFRAEVRAGQIGRQ